MARYAAEGGGGEDRRKEREVSGELADWGVEFGGYSCGRCGNVRVEGRPCRSRQVGFSASITQ
jgi:hypothetical protein